jgi:hypothetical protein
LFVAAKLWRRKGLIVASGKRQADGKEQLSADVSQEMHFESAVMWSALPDRDRDNCGEK